MTEVSYKEGKVKAVLEKLARMSAAFGIVVTDPPDAVYLGVDATVKPAFQKGAAFTVLEMGLDAVKDKAIENVYLVDKDSGNIHHISRKALDDIPETGRNLIGQSGKEILLSDTEIVGTEHIKGLPSFLRKSKEEEKYEAEVGYGFPHLHCHTEFSYLDGACKIKELMEFAAGQGFKQLAITDHGNLNGWFRFHREAKTFGVHPMFGVEFYIVPDRHKRGLSQEDRQGFLDAWGAPEAKEMIKDAQKEKRVSHHVVVLAKTMKGIKKLYRLNELSFKEGFYYRARIDYELLFSLAPDVVVMTACLGGLIPKLLRTDNYDKAVRVAKEWKLVFGPNFYLEIQPNEVPDQAPLNIALKNLGEELGIPLVATNDVHYTEEYLNHTHDVLICMTQMQENKNTFMDTEDRRRYDTTKLFLRSWQGMLKGFNTYHKDLGAKTIMGALENAEKIAAEITGKIVPTFKEHIKAKKNKKFEVKLDEPRSVGPVTEEKLLPDIKIPDKYDGPNEYLKALCYKGWRPKIFKRIPKAKHDLYKNRLNDELGQIFKLGFSEYFLVIYDLVHWALRNNILVGPGRGSVAGSLVSYLLGITLVDPVKWDLLFSRFISPDRIDFPDIDLDFPSPDREKIKQYLRDKYGADSVASVANFAAMKGKMVLKDVARVHRVPLHETAAVAQHIVIRASGDARGSQCLADTFREFKECKDFAGRYVRVCRFANRLEGQIRQKGVNAAGVVVSPGPLREYIPIETSKRTGPDEYITSWDRIDVEDAGLLKIDILGVDGLAYIQETVRKVKEYRGIEIDLEDIPLDDPKIYEALSEGKTLCVWQFESQGAIRTLKQLEPQTFEEIIATTALIRPGPLYSGMTAKYVKAKHDPSTIKFAHPLLEPILNKTAGQCIYQEQATRIVHDFAGFDWAEADAVRKCISKKMGKEYMQQYYQQYLAGTKKNEVPLDVAKKMWDAIGQFGQYAFNRSHSAAYSFLSYWTCYLKVHYALEFMSSVLATEKDDEKIRWYIKEARDRNVPVEPPNVNESGVKFEAIPDRKVIVAGLASIKGVGEKAVEEIIKHRPYKSLEDFLIRVPARAVNKTVVEVLLRSNSFGELVPDPKSKVKAMDCIMAWRKAKKRDDFTIEEFWNKHKDNEKKSWFNKTYPQGETYTDAELADTLQELINFPLAKHPVEKYKPKIIKRLKIPAITPMIDLPRIYGDVEFSSRQVWVIGVCTRVQYQSVATEMTRKQFEDRKEEIGASDNLEGTRRRVKLNIDDGTEFAMLMTSPDQYADMDEARVKTGQVFLARGKLTGNFRLNISHIINLSHYIDVKEKVGYEGGTHAFRNQTISLLEHNLLMNIPKEDYVNSVKESNRQKAPVRLPKLHKITTDQTCWIAGRVMQIRRNIAKKTGNEYAYIDVEDHWGSMEVFIPPKVWSALFTKKDKLMFRIGSVLTMRGNLRPKEDKPEEPEDEQKEDDGKKKWYRGTATFVATKIILDIKVNKLSYKVPKENSKNVARKKEEEGKKGKDAEKRKVKRVKRAKQ